MKRRLLHPRRGPPCGARQEGARHGVWTGGQRTRLSRAGLTSRIGRWDSTEAYHLVTNVRELEPADAPDVSGLPNRLRLWEQLVLRDGLFGGKFLLLCGVS
jgi:hypothetical protein